MATTDLTGEPEQTGPEQTSTGPTSPGQTSHWANQPGPTGPGQTGPGPAQTGPALPGTLAQARPRRQTTSSSSHCRSRLTYVGLRTCCGSSSLCCPHRCRAGGRPGPRARATDRAGPARVDRYTAGRPPRLAQRAGATRCHSLPRRLRRHRGRRPAPGVGLEALAGRRHRDDRGGAGIAHSCSPLRGRQRGPSS